MASTSIGVQVTDEKNTITQMLAAIMEMLTEEERGKIDSWLSLIEDHAEQCILSLKRKTASKRRREILTAAALYDAFLEFESRTLVKIRLPLMKDALSLTLCSINSVWTQLFDNRMFLRKDYLYPVYSNTSFNPERAVDAVLTNVSRAISEKKDDVETWITEIRILASKCLETMDHEKAEDYDSLLVGTAAIYAAIRSYPGKPRIHVSQRDLAQFCNHSPAMLSKVWLELFASG
ncbi:MAG: hypothetical protein ACFFDV_05510 [Candidatus Thorarchaeota archaeon]